MKIRNLKELKAFKHPKFKAPDVVYMIPCRRGLTLSKDGEASAQVFLTVLDEKFPGSVKYVRKNKPWHNIADEPPKNFKVVLIANKEGNVYRIAAFLPCSCVGGDNKAGYWHSLELDILFPIEQYPQYAYVNELGAHVEQ